MAGPIRQPIDLKSLERYIEQQVPEIKTPLEVKQVGRSAWLDMARYMLQIPQQQQPDKLPSSATANPTQLTSSLLPTAASTSYARNPRVSCSPRLRTKSTANTASSTPLRPPTSPSPAPSASAKMTPSSAPRSTSCLSSKVVSLRTPPSPTSHQQTAAQCGTQR